MNSSPFDRRIRALATAPRRRFLLLALGIALAHALPATDGDEAVAKRKRKRKKGRGAHGCPKGEVMCCIPDGVSDVPFCFCFPHC